MWQAGTQCSNDRSPKADRIIIQLIKGKPGEHGFGSLTLLWLGGKSRPCREQRSLATTGRGRDERQGMRAHGLQFAEQAEWTDGDETAWERAARPLAQSEA